MRTKRFGVRGLDRRCLEVYATGVAVAVPEQNEGVRAAEPQRVGVREFRVNLTAYLRRVRLGHSFLITSRDRILAEVRPPPSAERPRRRPGALRGRIRMAPDFDTLPPDVLSAMEGGEGG